MTLFWTIAAGMMVLALAFVVPPFLRKRAQPGISQDALNLSVIKQQLAELETDLSNGALDQDQYEAARKDLEIELLSDISADNGASRKPAEKSGRSALAVAGIGIPLLAIGLYQAIGNQEIIPLLARAADQARSDHATSADPTRGLPPMEELVEKLAERLEQEPDNIEGWIMLGRSHMAMGQVEQALKSYETAYRLAPDDPSLLLNYAEALAKMQDNRLSGRPAEMIEKAVEIEPRNPNGLWMMGLVHYERGTFSKAIQSWQRLTLLLPADGEDAAAVAAYIEEARSRAAPDTSPPRVAAAAVPSASAGQAKAVSESQGGIKVSVSLHPEFQDKVNAEDRVFIFARALQGPPMPLAAVRKQVKDLPVSLTLDDSMAMMPQLVLSAFPQVVVGARISKSGNAIPRTGDLQGEVSPIEPGRQAVVEIVINAIRP
jgi:cytochrome c-type biogenesis protein CcmH